ncbi:helix-turn-helix protein [Amycolatopsis echigonensis]|uniref:Helix-turn-helix protein n=1 Tax=Amycolatopsis echigonensis TaxID=2576905 RepID=A0A2N3WGE3_9PSEU|nr:helix-turn-helix protein [Amycolatopsis niigatensis]
MLRDARHRTGLSQERVANAIGMDRTMLLRLEQGKRTVAVDRLWDLATEMKTTVSALVASAEAVVAQVEKRPVGCRCQRPELQR